MKKWLTFWCIAYFVWVGENSRDPDMDLYPGKIVNIVPEFLGQILTTNLPLTTNVPEITTQDLALSTKAEVQLDGDETSSFEIFTTKLNHQSQPPDRYPVVHAGLPRALAVSPLPLEGADHELVFNVSWMPSLGPPAKDYSLEVVSETDTTDCRSPICYEYDIPGESRWHLIPKVSAPVAETCAIRPGCAYSIRLIAHPWDGHSHANLRVQLDECVAGVCSCGHAPRLPTPVVQAHTVTLGEGGTAVNVTWSLPKPAHPLRLPPGLHKHYYFVSLGKQMVSDAHPSPWFAHTITRQVPTEGLVSDGDVTRWVLLSIDGRSVERGGKRSVQPDVKLLARVSLVDDRGCTGPAGNATAYDPTAAHKIRFGTYVLWASLGGACVIAMAAILAASARGVKRVLAALRRRPAPASAPLEPLRHRPAWLPLQLRTNDDGSACGQVEQSPLYVQKECEAEEEDGDEWEVRRSRVRLGSLIGSGAFGRVHVATLDMATGETVVVAAKMLTDNASEEEMQDFLREIDMLKHVGSHKHVIRLIGCCTKRAPLIALLEHAPRGDLLTLLRAARGRRKVDEDSNVTRRACSVSDATERPSEADSEYTNLSDGDPPLTMEEKLYVEERVSNDHYVAEPALHLDSSTMRDYALQVALGMRHLEERGITHRDLAARNILVDGTGVLKVADFGLSRSGVYVHTRSRPVPLRWLAPEAILHSQYSNATDVWAFAVLLWEIATLGGFPYAELSNEQVPTFLTLGGRLPKPARASLRLYSLMQQCWSPDPQHRPTFAQIVTQLTAQNQLYVDLDSVFPDQSELNHR